MIIFDNNIDLEKYEMAFFAFVAGDSFPWFYHNKPGNHLHELLEKSPMVDREGSPKSNFFQPCKYLLTKICKKNGLSIKRFYSACFISTIHDESEHDKIDVDHLFDHHVFLMNVNVISTGNTYLFDYDNNKIGEIGPELFRATIFQKTPYACGFPSLGERRLQLKMTFELG